MRIGVGINLARVGVLGGDAGVELGPSTPATTIEIEILTRAADTILTRAGNTVIARS
jgi:hypothetical protein